ncbi:MAG TPA: NHL repeat-containing protein [Pseudomonadota bacterium]|nr:NHL repeat-containing protein [Pseudomonadota bacterium]HMU39247.1 NHL repeat-containing protein [Pseudomonadota bacterium]
MTRAFVLGQIDTVMNASLAYGLTNPYSVLFVPDVSNPLRTKLIVADSGNRRVLIWNDVPTSNRPADAVLGQPDVYTSSSGPYGGVNEGSLGWPVSVSTDGTQLAVSDGQAYRVLFWGQIPMQAPTRGPIPAVRIWGQSNFQNASPNAGSPDPSPRGITLPFAAFGPTGRFFVSDYHNARLLGFTTPPAGGQTSASFVAGQTDFVSNIPSPTDSGMNHPRGLSTDGTQLFVPDSGYHRIQVFDNAMFANGAKATAVIGQSNFTAISPNAGGPLSATTLYTPSGAAVAPSTPRFLFVADFSNNRVVRYPITTVPMFGLAADLVLGQPNMTSGSPNQGGPATAATMNRPIGVATDGKRLAVADYSNHRVLLWNTLPTVSGANADVILGQPNAGSVLPNVAPARGPLQFVGPQGVDTDGERLALADTTNHRILLWKKIPVDGTQPPDLVLGQTDFQQSTQNGGTGAVSGSGLSSPNWISLFNGRLAVADSGNNRILIWNVFPTQNNQPADICLGQTSCTSALASAGTSGFRVPSGLSWMGEQLIVSDTGNHRVLLFPSPVTQGSSAKIVLGQADFVTVTANSGGLSAKSLYSPRGVTTYDGKLLVADRANHRVLVWNAIPTASGIPGNSVLCQIDFVTSYTRPDQHLCEAPLGVIVNQGRIYVSSGGQSRILYWNAFPSENGIPADGVLGQTSFLGSAPNSAALPSIERLSVPTQIAAFDHQLFVADQEYNRIVIRPLPSL